jgi:putative thioredoxin
MSDSANAIEVTQENFDSAVIAGSKERPVLVDFWAPWCGPCRLLTPILEGLAKDYGGKFLLAKVNTDQNPQLALDFNIRSIPTLILFHGGKPVEEFFGAQPEPLIRALLGRYVERDSDRLRKAAAGAVDNGDPGSAEQLLREALASDPGNERIHPDLAKVLIERHKYDEAEEILNGLPLGRQQDDDIAALLIRAKYGRIADGSPGVEALKARVDQDPHNIEVRYQLAARQIMSSDFEPALDNLIAILERNRTHGDNGARKAVLDVFTLLGNQGPLIKRYRTLLSAVLH